jgi:hypothetical protein
MMAFKCLLDVRSRDNPPEMRSPSINIGILLDDLALLVSCRVAHGLVEGPSEGKLR